MRGSACAIKISIPSLTARKLVLLCIEILSVRDVCPLPGTLVLVALFVQHL